jgi:tricorn protease
MLALPPRARQPVRIVPSSCLVYVPEFATASTDGEWIIEGYGVDPDIEVDNDPGALLAGRDPQLERAIAEVLKAMETNPGTLPPKPADRVKTQ